MSAPKKGHRRCRVCYHLERTRIELLLAGGASQRSVARKFGLSEDSVQRHWTRHIDDERRARLIVGPVAREALASQVAEESSSVLDHYRAIRAGLYTLYDAAVSAHDRSGGALIAGRLIEVNNAVAKLTGELAQSPLIQHNHLNVFLQNPETQRFLQELAQQLKPFPDALRAVVAWLESREAQVLRAVERPALEHTQ